MRQENYEKLEQLHHKVHDEYRERLDTAEQNIDDLIKHMMLLLATILGLSIGLTSLKEKIVDITYLKISWASMLLAFFIGTIYLIYSGKRYRHNKYQELKVMSDITIIGMDKEQNKISEEESTMLGIAAYHNWESIPDIRRFIETDFYLRNKEVIDANKKLLPSSKSYKKNDADLSDKKFHFFMASNTVFMNVIFYLLTFISLFFLFYHIIVFKS